MKTEVGILLLILGAGVLAWLGLLAARWLLDRAPREWEAVDHADPDGTLRIGVERGSEFREVRVVPPGDPYEALAEIGEARRAARELAAELNK